VAEDPTGITAIQCSGILCLHGELAAEDLHAFLAGLTPDQRWALPRLHTDCFNVIAAAAHDQAVAEAARGGNGDGKPTRTPKPSVLHQSRS